jgi:hypothetical protein
MEDIVDIINLYVIFYHLCIYLFLYICSLLIYVIGLITVSENIYTTNITLKIKGGNMNIIIINDKPHDVLIEEAIDMIEEGLDELRYLAHDDKRYTVAIEVFVNQVDKKISELVQRMKVKKEMPL